MSLNLSFWENFTESIAVFLSKALTDDETESVISSWNSFQHRLRQLSAENLTRLRERRLEDRPYCKHGSLSCSTNCVRTFLKNFIVVFGVKYCLGLFPALFRGRVAADPKILLKLAGKDTLGLSMFLATSTTAYKAVLCFLRRTTRCNHWLQSFIAGAVSGIGILFDKNETRRLMIALYLSTRSLHFLARFIWRYKVEPRWDPNCRTRELEHLVGSVSIPPRIKGALRSPSLQTPEAQVLKPIITAKTELDANLVNKKANAVRRIFRQSSALLLMMASSAQILYAFILEPDTLASSYRSFLLNHGSFKERAGPKRDRQFLDLFKSSLDPIFAGASNIYIQDSSDLGEKIPAGLPVSDMMEFRNLIGAEPHQRVMCSLTHDASVSCSRGFLHIFASEFPRALKLYLPLNIVMTLVFRFKKLQKRPIRIFLGVLKSALRSTLFLTLYVATAFSSVCLLRRLRSKDERWMYALNGALAGTMVMLEVPGRRLELALYCFPRALESAWNIGVKYHWWPSIPGGEAVYFSFAMGIMMSLYQHDPASIQEGYRKILYRFYGTT